MYDTSIYSDENFVLFVSFRCIYAILMEFSHLAEYNIFLKTILSAVYNGRIVRNLS